MQLASSSLLRLGQETEKDAIKQRESVYLLLDLVRQTMHAISVVDTENIDMRRNVGLMHVFVEFIIVVIQIVSMKLRTSRLCSYTELGTAP